jgi:hypothetical protein
MLDDSKFPSSPLRLLLQMRHVVDIDSGTEVYTAFKCQPWRGVPGLRIFVKEKSDSIPNQCRWRRLIVADSNSSVHFIGTTLCGLACI